ncbi:MAG: hypothetical protein Q9217_004137 [Psora testacea]
MRDSPPARRASVEYLHGDEYDRLDRSNAPRYRPIVPGEQTRPAQAPANSALGGMSKSKRSDYSRGDQHDGYESTSSGYYDSDDSFADLMARSKSARTTPSSGALEVGHPIVRKLIQKRQEISSTILPAVKVDMTMENAQNPILIQVLVSTRDRAQEKGANLGPLLARQSIALTVTAERGMIFTRQVPGTETMNLDQIRHPTHIPPAMPALTGRRAQTYNSSSATTSSRRRHERAKPPSGGNDYYSGTHSERYDQGKYSRFEKYAYGHSDGKRYEYWDDDRYKRSDNVPPRSSTPPRYRSSKTPSQPVTIPDHYATLGLRFSAGASDIKRAARQKRIETHPDRLKKPGMSEAELSRIDETAKKVGMAAEVLKDEKTKREYDLLLSRMDGLSF